MENPSNSRNIQIECLYTEYSERIFNYISSKVGNREDAENLSQDVWLRLIESGVDIIEDTAQAYIYRIAANLVNDYLRRLYTRMEIDRDLLADLDLTVKETPEQELNVLQILEMELAKVESLPRQRRLIYSMSRFDDMTVADIANELSLSLRTVENHLRMGRQDVRNYLKAAV